VQAYLIRRLLGLVLVLLAITALTYVIYFLLPSENPALLFVGKAPTPTVVAQVEHNLGLNRPIWIQYLLFLKHLVLGDAYGWPGLGFSYVTHQSVLHLLGPRIVVTATLALGAAIIWLVLGVSVGVVSAITHKAWVDHLSMVGALVFVSAPVFWLGLMFLWFFTYKLGIAPGTGYVPFSAGVASWFGHMIMPWIVLALLYAAWYARMIRGAMLSVLGEDFVRTARAKGVSETRVILRHALRASLTPALTMFGMDLAGLVGSTVVVEEVFNLQGIGQLAITSVFTGDAPVILAVTLLAAFAITLANLVVDILYAVLDPRIRYGSHG
jgi:peptide/nickel transport system permease protein